MVTPYASARRAGDGVLRRRLLDVASDLLVEHGPEALSMRTLAAAAGCSTTVLYSSFGGKDGLAEALFVEGFRRFAERLAEVSADLPPLERLLALGEAYRDHALREPGYYRVMFGGIVPRFTPSEPAMAAAAGTLGVLRDQVQVCMDTGAFRAGDAQQVAEVLWAASHGAVSLQLTGHFPADSADVAAERYRLLLTAVGSAFLPQQRPEQRAPEPRRPEDRRYPA